MIKIRIHLENYIKFIDEEVYAEIKLPSTPRKGDIILLDEDTCIMLTNKIHVLDLKNKATYQDYFFGVNSDKLNTEDIILEDVNFVKEIVYQINKDYVVVILSLEN